jgi:hypothetical protein
MLFKIIQVSLLLSGIDPSASVLKSETASYIFYWAGKSYLHSHLISFCFGWVTQLTSPSVGLKPFGIRQYFLSNSIEIQVIYMLLHNLSSTPSPLNSNSACFSKTIFTKSLTVVVFPVAIAQSSTHQPEDHPHHTGSIPSRVLHPGFPIELIL